MVGIIFKKKSEVKIFLSDLLHEARGSFLCDKLMYNIDAVLQLTSLVKQHFLYI